MHKRCNTNEAGCDFDWIPASSLLILLLQGQQAAGFNLQPSLHVCVPLLSSPSLAGDDAHLLAVAVRRDAASLPPLVVRGVDDVEDVPVPEAKPLAGQPAVLGPLVVEQGPV